MKFELAKSPWSRIASDPFPTQGIQPFSEARNCSGLERISNSGIAKDMISLCGSRSLQNGGNGLRQDFEVEPERPVIDVFHVEFHPFFEGNGAAAVDLPQAGDARADAEAVAVPVLIESLVIAHGKRPGADQAHVALQDVEELRKLINTRLPQELPHGREARIISDLEHRPARLVQVLDLALPLGRIRHHGPELVQVKPWLVAADALLNEEARPG